MSNNQPDTHRQAPYAAVPDYNVPENAPVIAKPGYTDSNRTSVTSTGHPLRSWQEDTWNGPAPYAQNPFDEPENAPELREGRSASLDDRTGVFWQPQQELGGYRSDMGTAQNASPTVRRNTVKKRKKSGLRSLTVTLILLTAVLVTLRLTLFTVRQIHVIGNVTCTADYVISRSGIHTGDNLLFLRSEDVERGIESDYLLQFVYLEKKVPGEVTVSVREREAVAYLSWCGILYTMDKNGVVLFETEDPDVFPSGLVHVKGLEIRNIRAGQTVSLNSAVQQEAYASLFLELRVMDLVDQVMEADLTDVRALYLATRDGFSVKLGNTEALHAKLRALQLVRNELITMNYTEGTINVTVPEAPVFTPAEK